MKAVLFVRQDRRSYHRSVKKRAETASSSENEPDPELDLARAPEPRRRRCKQRLSACDHRRRRRAVEADAVVAEVPVACARHIESLDAEVHVTALAEADHLQEP